MNGCELKENAKKLTTRASIAASTPALHQEKIVELRRSTSIVALEELVQCGICLNRLANPRMLLCQHTFCLACIEQLFCSDPSSKTLTCPTCGVARNVENPQKLPRNLHVDSLLQLLQNKILAVSSSKDVLCSKCQIVCQSEDEDCIHCHQTFCRICWIEHLNTLKSSLLSLTECLQEFKVRLYHQLDEYKEHCSKQADYIKSATEKMIREIREKEQSALTQLEKIKCSEEHLAQTLVGQISTFKQKIESFILEPKASNEQQVQAFMSFHREAAKMVDEVSHLGECRPVFDAQTFKVQQQCDLVETEVLTRQIAVVDLVPQTHFLKNAEAMSTYYISKQFTPKLVWSKCPRPTGLGIPPWAKHLLYIAATDRKAVLVVDRNSFKIIKKLTSPDMLCPHGIAFSEQHSETYVSDKWKHCVHVFSSSGDYVKSLCLLSREAGELRSPGGLAVNRRNELIVCDAGNDRVVVLDPLTGSLLATLGVTNKKRTEFQAPTSVAVHDDNIIVADQGNNRIKVFSDDGKKLLEFGSFGSNNGQFRTIEAVTCDPAGLIFVGDAGNARIQVFKPDGSLVHIFGSHGYATGKFAWISGLLVTPQGEIVVTDYKNRQLQIF